MSFTTIYVDLKHCKTYVRPNLTVPGASISVDIFDVHRLAILDNNMNKWTNREMIKGTRGLVIINANNNNVYVDKIQQYNI